ncbi:MAG: hypothetical protein AUI01_12150 [Ktedonobacter sp. 13_2_20CM_2_56_8]|nr:MAG: hypothetical protein AUI01_12150 [Ktedonobacter sp. 13_2_20CM_2_56_8]
MKRTLAEIKSAQSQAKCALLHRIPSIPDDPEKNNSNPKVFIKGDIRLRVTESYAGRRPVRVRYIIETEGMQEPLHVIWMIEGNVLNHTVHCIEVAFDVRGISAGETLTRLLTAQVTNRGGQGCIVHSSVFIQIFVVRDTLPYGRSELLQSC